MVYRFTDVVIDSRTGLNPRKNFVLGSGDNYYITIKDIYNGKVNFTDKTDKVDDEAIQIIKRRSRIKVGDVLFVSIGRIGEAAIVMNKDDSWDVNESVFVFTLNNKIITPEYFCTMFQSQGVKQYLSGNSSGSTFKSIKMNQLERMTFDLPPVTTQKSITTKLTAVRRIIDLRTSQLAALDNLVKARFVEMFGDSEFNMMQWPTKKLSELCAVSSSKRIYQNEQSTEGVPFLRISDLNERIDNVKNAPELFIPINKYNELKENGLVPTEGDILVTSRGTLGRCYIVRPEDEFYFQDGMISWLSDLNSQITSVYLSQLFAMSGIQKQIASLQAGSTVAYLSIAMLKKLNIMLPPLDLQEQFAAFVEQTDKSKVVVQKALDEAQTLFDSLMQEYFG